MEQQEDKQNELNIDIDYVAKDPLEWASMILRDSCDAIIASEALEDEGLGDKQDIKNAASSNILRVLQQYGEYLHTIGF